MEEPKFRSLIAVCVTVAECCVKCEVNCVNWRSLHVIRYGSFLLHDVMLAWYMLYIHLSVSPSQTVTLPKRLNVGSCQKCYAIAQGL